MNKFAKQKGFTLPEVIVGMAVITLVIFSTTNLVVQIIRSNTRNMDTLIAYGLAQEGIEGVRNIRDGNWLLGADFNGDLGKNIKNEWGDELPQLSGEKLYYTIDLGVMVPSSGFVTDRDQVKGNTPWVLDLLVNGEPDADAAKTLLYKFDDSGAVRYGHAGGFNPTGNETRFHRYVSIENISDPGESNMYRVASVVTWDESGHASNVRLETELTDWNQGQL